MRLPSARLAQCTRAKAVLKLLLINPDGAGDTNNAVGWDLALPNPEINSIGGNSESLGNLAYFSKLRRHRHDLVFSSKPTWAVRSQEVRVGRKSVGSR